MNWTKWEKSHPAYRRKLEKCILMVKKYGSKKANAYAICRATVKKK